MDLADRLSTQPNNTPPYSGEWVDLDWHSQAGCRDNGMDMLSPENPGPLIRDYCSPCKVRRECGLDALRQRETRGQQGVVGIWGGVYIGFHTKQRKSALDTLRMLYHTESAA